MRLFDMVHYGSIRVSRIVYVIGVDSVFFKNGRCKCPTLLLAS